VEQFVKNITICPTGPTGPAGEDGVCREIYMLWLLVLCCIKICCLC
jgi:hypothetical protein